MRLGEQNKVQVMSSGSLALNRPWCQEWGYLKDIIEIHGPESSGKTTVALHAVAQAQKRGGVCGAIDAEHASRSSYTDCSRCKPMAGASHQILVSKVAGNWLALVQLIWCSWLSCALVPRADRWEISVITTMVYKLGWWVEPCVNCLLLSTKRKQLPSLSITRKKLGLCSEIWN